MKIAVPVTKENEIEGHFGHCESYSVFTITDNKEISGHRSVDSSQGCGCKSDIGSILASDGVTLMLAAGIGEGATRVLNNNGIEVIRGWSGNAMEVVKLYLAGMVEDRGSSCYKHRPHQEHEGEHKHKANHEHGCNHDDGHQCNHN
jgi:predicted Fe-Mo cluster-binding NifX family protein